MANPPLLLLGSSSPYRATQLRQLGLEFHQKSPDCDEDEYKKLGLEPAELAKRLAVEKALSLKQDSESHIVITGDQLVHFEGKVLGKSGSEEAARADLKRLSGKTHEIITAIATLYQGQCKVHLERAHLHMRTLTTEQIQNYVAKDQPMDCAGSYKIESLGVCLFQKIECDDFTAITGIPLIALCTMLSEYGYPLP